MRTSPLVVARAPQPLMLLPAGDLPPHFAADGGDDALWTFGLPTDEELPSIASLIVQSFYAVTQIGRMHRGRSQQLWTPRRTLRCPSSCTGFHRGSTLAGAPPPKACSGDLAHGSRSSNGGRSSQRTHKRFKKA